MPKDKSGERGTSSSSRTKDPRFSNFETDPRFRLPSRKKTKTTIDKRFSGRLKDDDFTRTAKVDRYGRKLNNDSRKKALQSLYQEEEDEDEEDDDDDDVEGGEEDEDVEVDDDEVVQRELRSADVKYDPARGGGFSDSESESDLDEDDEGGAEVEPGPSLDKFREEQADVETGEITHRIAIVNLDWDHIKAVDLMALFSSFAPTGGRIEKLSVYPSEFGKGRMQREELEGPPKEIFKKSKGGDGESREALGSDSEGDELGQDQDDELDDLGSDEEANDLIKEGDDKDFDSDALRSYQMDRLRYYYAVMVCSNASTAQKIYEATDGSEYMSSSNFLDLRFVPDDVTFDDEPRDECDSVPAGYKPIEFVTDALQHSKVKLTWDMHPEELSRKESIKKAFSGSRADIADNDLRAYLASDSEGEDDENDDEEPAEAGGAGDGPQLTKKELARRKMRAALGLADEPAPKASKTGPVGDMQITFTAALTEDSNEAATNVEETTIEKYKRKEKERKAKRKEKAVAKREGVQEAADADADEQTEDLGFDDPFFTSAEPAQPSKSAVRKEERRQKREAKAAEEAANAAEKAQLELLMAENTNDQAVHLDHFDMNEIVREEKRKGKKQKKRKEKTGGKEARGGLQEEFDLDVADPRFKAVFESHEFAIDPSNPKFKATSGMKKLLEEGRKRKAGSSGNEEDHDRRGKKKSKARHA